MTVDLPKPIFIERAIGLRIDKPFLGTGATARKWREQQQSARQMQAEFDKTVTAVPEKTEEDAAPTLVEAPAPVAPPAVEESASDSARAKFRERGAKPTTPEKSADAQAAAEAPASAPEDFMGFVAGLFSSRPS